VRSLTVGEPSQTVVEYLMDQYDNFLQFARQKDGTTRCAQVLQMLLGDHVNHDVSSPLEGIQLDVSDAFYCIVR